LLLAEVLRLAAGEEDLLLQLAPVALPVAASAQSLQAIGAVHRRRREAVALGGRGPVALQLLARDGPAGRRDPGPRLQVDRVQRRREAGPGRGGSAEHPLAG